MICHHGNTIPVALNQKRPFSNTNGFVYDNTIPNSDMAVSASNREPSAVDVKLYRFIKLYKAYENTLYQASMNNIPQKAVQGAPVQIDGAFQRTPLDLQVKNIPNENPESIIGKENIDAISIQSNIDRQGGERQNKMEEYDTKGSVQIGENKYDYGGDDGDDKHKFQDDLGINSAAQLKKRGTEYIDSDVRNDDRKSSLKDGERWVRIEETGAGSVTGPTQTPTPISKPNMAGRNIVSHPKQRRFHTNCDPLITDGVCERAQEARDIAQGVTSKTEIHVDQDYLQHMYEDEDDETVVKAWRNFKYVIHGKHRDSFSPVV